MAAGTEITLGWRDDALDFRIDAGGDGMPRITRLAAPGAVQRTAGEDAALPLVDVVLAGEGRVRSGGRYCESEAGGRFRYQGHDETERSPWR
ncbi:MAG: hypothetical protein JO242_19195, partial [Streptosporangiaceae bacterium]|nr:hypothetical protein [Streptosporangiaceae bacterium]